MKNLASKALSFCTASIPLAFFFARIALGDDTSARLSNPFLLPQTNIFLGSVNYAVTVSNSSASSTSNLDEGGINTYGFDIEVNATSFLNIGAYFRVEALSVEYDRRYSQTVGTQFATVLGGFTRFFYVPPFLKGKYFTTNIFSRIDLGGGPVFLSGPSGLLGQTGIHFGIETYINKWIGLSASYGQLFELGRETLVSGYDETSSYTAQFKNATIWSQGRVFLVSLKTTVF